MDSPTPAVRLDLFFPLAGPAAAALPSLRDVQSGNRCLVVGPRGRSGAQASSAAIAADAAAADA